MIVRPSKIFTTRKGDFYKKVSRKAFYKEWHKNYGEDGLRSVYQGSAINTPISVEANWVKDPLSIVPQLSFSRTDDESEDKDFLMDRPKFVKFTYPDDNGEKKTIYFQRCSKDETKGMSLHMKLVNEHFEAMKSDSECTMQCLDHTPEELFITFVDGYANLFKRKDSAKTKVEQISFTLSENTVIVQHQ